MIHPWNEAAWTALPALERLPPALLLAGPRGTGKSAFARTLAQALLCARRSPAGMPCGACPGCRLFASDNHPDLRIVEPAAAGDDEDSGDAEEGSRPKPAASARWIKVDAVRALSQFLSLTSHFGGRKVVLIDPAERLHPSAANALLKTLEEPTNTQFILVTAQPARMPATVRSRCVRIPLTLPDPGIAHAWLRAQGAAQPEAALAMAGGAPLRALDLSTPESTQLRRRLIDAVFSNPRFDPVAAVDILGTEGVSTLVPALQRWCYDLLLCATTGSVRYYPDCAQILHPVARRAPARQLLRFARELQEVARHLEHPLNPRLLAESCLIGYRNAIASGET
jgi:DNA polymerase III subunit delta'